METSIELDLWSFMRRVARASDVPVDRVDTLDPSDLAELERNNSLDDLDRAADTVGVRTTRFEGDLKEAFSLADRGAPVILRHPLVEGSWILIEDGPGRRARVWQAHESDSFLAGVSEAGRRLGLATDEQLVGRLAQPSELCGAAGHHMPPLKRIIGLLSPDRSDLWAILIFAFANGALLLATPIAVQALVNFVAFGGAIAPIVVLALLLAIALSFGSLLLALQSWVVEIVQRRIFVRVVGDLAHRLPRLRREQADSAYAPELVNRFFDTPTIQKTTSFLLLNGISAFLGILIGLLVLGFYHPLLLAMDIVIVVAVCVIVFVMGRGGIRTAIEESHAKYAVAGWLEELARQADTFKQPDAQAMALRRADALARRYVVARRSHFRVLFRQILGALGLQVLASVALLGVGGLLVIRGELTLGQLIAAELIVTYVVGTVAKLGKHFEAFYDLMAATDKVGHLLDLEPEPPGHHRWSEPPNDGGSVVNLRELKLVHPLRREALNDFNAHIEPGDHVGVVDSSGVLSTLLIEALNGLRTPNSGEITIDGLSIKSVRRDVLRCRVAHVAESGLFDGKISDNVSLGREVSSERLNDLVDRLGLTATLQSLPDGLDSELPPHAAPLTSVERRLVALARAVAARPALLLIDGAFDGLPDDALERALDLVFDESAPWTVVLASRRREVLARCSRVLTLDTSKPRMERAS